MKLSRTFPIFLVLIVLCLFLGSCMTFFINSIPDFREINYQVTGGSKVTIRYTDKDGDIQELKDQPIPWSKTFNAKINQKKPFLALIVLDNQELSDNLTAAIYVDGILIESSSEKNEFGFTRADGFIYQQKPVEK